MSYISQNHKAIRELITEKLGDVYMELYGGELEFNYGEGHYTYSDEIDSLETLRAAINSEMQFMSLINSGYPFNTIIEVDAANGYVRFEGPREVKFDDVFDRNIQRIKVDELLAQLEAPIPEDQAVATRSMIQAMKTV